MKKIILRKFSKSLFILVLLLAFALVACKQITKEEAESAALSFVNERVKFFTSNNETTNDIDAFTSDQLTSFKKGDSWVVVIHIQANVSGDVKSNDLSIVVDSAGKVTEFNGKKIVIK